MEKRLTMILACLFLSIGMALAQKAVTGTVVSQEDGQPIIGATIRVVGANVGAVTDADGKFSLSLPSGHNKLKVTYVGMMDQDVTVKGNSVRVVLSPDETNLDEVMVVAYGTAKKSAFTGSAAVVDAEDINKAQVSNPVDALVGKVSGVQLYNNTGQPGVTSPSINIRGISSINAGTSPLVIVDGAPYEGDLNSISNQDVASMTVLKDAASAALYGARGANGVILITTKNAERGKGKITVDAKWGSNSRAIPSYNTINSPAKYYEMWYQGLKNYAMANGYNNDRAALFANQNLTANNDYGLAYNVYNVPEGEYLIGSNGKLNPNATLGRVFSYGGQEYMLMPDDWTDATYNNGLRQEYTVTATGSNDKSNFYGSVNYLDNEGITVASNYKRLSGRLKADYQIKPWLKVAGNFNYAHYNTNYIASDGDSSDSGNMFALTQIAPIYPLYIRDGKGNIIFDSVSGLNRYDYGDGNGWDPSLQRPFMGQSNPLSDNQLNVANQEGNTFGATGSAEIRLPFGFKFTSVNTVFTDESRSTQTINPYFGQYASQNGAIYKSHSRTWSYNYQQLLNWVHDFGKHNVEVMLGHEYYRTYSYYLTANKSNQFIISNTELSGAVVGGSQDSYTGDYNVEGYFGRALYNYDEKYFGSVSFRRDASSRFAPENRWGNFWSFGGAWIISKENWFNAPWVDELKLKASYGEQGNDQIGNYYYYTNSYTLVNSNDQISIVPYIYGNRDITWEKNGNFNIGLEFSLFRGRLAGSVEYFYRKTSDMLFSFPLAPSFGYQSYYANIGDMRNSGVEVELNGDIIRTRDLTWSLNLNMTAYNNKITRLPQERRTMTVDGVDGYSSGSYFYGEGESMYTFYMPKYAGVDPETGEALYWKNVTDANGNVTGQEKTSDYSKADYHLCGTALPNVYGGFGTSLSWKGLELSVNFTYQIGGKVYDTTYQQEMSFERGRTFNSDLLNAWTPENTNTNVPRLQYNDDYTASTSDRWLTDASYLCLQNFSVAYNLPKNWISTLGLGGVRLYVSGDNLWTWSKRQGLDPRQSISGTITQAYYAPMRTISGGLTITF